jgi:hypothetical protein
MSEAWNAPGRLRRVTVGPILGGPPLSWLFGAGSKNEKLKCDSSVRRDTFE